MTGALLLVLRGTLRFTFRGKLRRRGQRFFLKRPLCLPDLTRGGSFFRFLAIPGSFLVSGA